MTDRATCDTCGKLSEKTNTSYTLVSNTGWRLSREARPDGKILLLWSCPKCWSNRKAAAARAGEKK